MNLISSAASVQVRDRAAEGALHAALVGAKPYQTFCLTSETDPERAWDGPVLPEASYMTPGLVQLQTAEALRRLGDAGVARAYADQAVLTAPKTHLRGQVHRWAGYALVLTAQGEVEEAADAAATMLDRAGGMESGRLHDRLTSVVSALRPYSAEPEVASTLERAEVQLAEPGA